MHDPLIIEACAKAAHEANKIYCEFLGDFSQVHWDAAPKWQKESARLGVVGALDGNTPEQSHEGWLAQKEKDGWTWGPVKDADLKQHPCFVPYQDLPPEQQAKDHLFLDIVRCMSRNLPYR